MVLSPVTFCAPDTQVSRPVPFGSVGSSLICQRFFITSERPMEPDRRCYRPRRSTRALTHASECAVRSGTTALVNVLPRIAETRRAWQHTSCCTAARGDLHWLRHTAPAYGGPRPRSLHTHEPSRQAVCPFPQQGTRPGQVSCIRAYPTPSPAPGPVNREMHSVSYAKRSARMPCVQCPSCIVGVASTGSRECTAAGD